MNMGPIVIVDDDDDDKEIIELVWKDLPYKNQLVFFRTGEQVLKFLKTEEVIPFLILCDVNIPKMDGFELKRRLLTDDSLHYQSIPFIFWSSEVSTAQIKKSYDLGGNGFFVKENKIDYVKTFLSCIMEYWIKSKTPM
jgi:CheY-like chemotaxis protein